jgi:hypothetical protein
MRIFNQRFRYSAEKEVAFESIMKLERGFRDVVEACAHDAEAFLGLIREVCPYYMRFILNHCYC